MEGTNPYSVPHPERIASNYFRRNVLFALTMPTFSYQEINQLRNQSLSGPLEPKGKWESSAALWRTGCLLLLSNHENNKKNIFTRRGTLWKEEEAACYNAKTQCAWAWMLHTHSSYTQIHRQFFFSPALRATLWMQQPVLNTLYPLILL